MSFFGIDDPDQAIAIGGILGGILGTFATAILSHFLQLRHESKLIRKHIVDKYLLQLQDAISDLYERLDVFVPFERMKAESKEYYYVTLLYALARIFAFKHIFIADGVYPEINNIRSKLGNQIKDWLDDIDNYLRDLDIKDNSKQDYRYYDNVALGELVVDNTGDHLTTITYKDFKEKYDKRAESSLHQSLERITKFVESELNSKECDILKSKLVKFEEELSKITTMKTSQ